MRKKVFVRTYGCQMNTRDSEVIVGLLCKAGYVLVDSPESADAVIFNTCSVRQHAEDKVWSEIGRIVKAPCPAKKIIGLVGCMAQNYKEYVFERSPGVDFVVGPQDLHKIPKIISKLLENNGQLQEVKENRSLSLFSRKIWETGSTKRPEEIYHIGFHQDKDHAYVVISEGCSNYCSYCVVPYVRGDLRHRDYKEILREIEEAALRGIANITLLGQNVNAYKFEGTNFAGLISMVNGVKGLKEFGFVTSHPKDTSLELLKTMRDLGKLKRHLHLPVQSGSDRVLKLMNRNYSRRDYLDLIANYRKIVTNGALSTDIIVGFPTEAEEDFRQTYDLLKGAEFNAAFIFKYSPRPHTVASRMPDDVPKEEKERRHRLVLELQKEISRKHNV